MGWLIPLIRRTVDKAISEAVDRHADAAIDRAIAASPVIQFIKAMQTQMLAVDPNMDAREAWNVACGTLRDFLHEEGVKFGDPAHDWTRDGAVDLIHEYEIHHWEMQP